MLKEVDSSEIDLIKIKIPEGYLYASDYGLAFVPKKHNRETHVHPDFQKFVDLFNLIMNRASRGDKSSSEQFNARMKEGYTMDDFKKVITLAKLDPWHKDSNYQWLTTEYITRDKTMNKYGSVKEKSTSETYQDLKR